MAIQTRTPEVVGNETGLMVAPVSALPSAADVIQRMTWMSEMRPIFQQYVQHHMDPARHMYSFENNRYTPMTVDTLHGMMAEGKKPALNQDGIHNLMSLYECYADEPTIHETRDDGHYTCRATVKLISFRTGTPMGAGTGSCSTRESKYAYRWVGDRQIPKGVDKRQLKSREMEGRNGSYTRYRLENEDIADVEATVLQMAVKRAKSAAVKALPLVSEMFAVVGDPDEERREEDARRQELLAQLKPWLVSMKPTPRQKAILAVFGEPLRPDDIAKLDEDRLAVALQVIEIGTQQGVKWDGATLAADLKQALQASAQKSREDLFGDQGTAEAQQAAREGATPTTEKVDVQTGEIVGDEDPRQATMFDPALSAALDREDNPEYTPESQD